MRIFQQRSVIRRKPLSDSHISGVSPSLSLRHAKRGEGVRRRRTGGVSPRDDCLSARSPAISEHIPSSPDSRKYPTCRADARHPPHASRGGGSMSARKKCVHTIAAKAAIHGCPCTAVSL